MYISKRGFGLVGLLIILGIVIVGGGAYLYVQNRPASTSPNSETAANTKVSDATTSTTYPTDDAAPHAVFPFLHNDAPAVSYSNEQYGFQMLYPKGFDVDPTISPIQGFPTLLTYGRQVVSFWDLDGKVNIIVSTDSRDLHNCADVPIDTQATHGKFLSVKNASKKIIHGTEFQYYETFAGEFPNYKADHIYKTVKNNICYGIDAHVDQADGALQLNVWDELDSIAAQFYFSN